MHNLVRVQMADRVQEYFGEMPGIVFIVVLSLRKAFKDVSTGGILENDVQFVRRREKINERHNVGVRIPEFLQNADFPKDGIVVLRFQFRAINDLNRVGFVLSIGIFTTQEMMTRIDRPVGTAGNPLIRPVELFKGEFQR